MSAATLADTIFDNKEDMSDNCFKTLMEATAELKKADDADQLLVVAYTKITLKTGVQPDDAGRISSEKCTMIVHPTRVSAMMPEDWVDKFLTNGLFLVSDDRPLMEIGESYQLEDTIIGEGKNMVHYHPAVIILSVTPYNKRTRCEV